MSQAAMEGRTELPFQRHAALFLDKMPTLHCWSAQHTSVMRSTVNRYLVPFFGSKKVSAITEVDLSSFERHLDRFGLSVVRKTNIRRAARQILDTQDMRFADVAQPVFTKGRIDRETDRWMEHYQAFKEYWANHRGRPIPKNKSFSIWVVKQRFRFNRGAMAASQVALLKAIKFPFVAPTCAATPTNLDYAKQLIDFYLMNGHFAPTLDIGGPALTYWVITMRQSNGTKGIVTAPDEAKLAEVYLYEHIPEFSWEKTIKSELNRARWLSFNGYPQSAPPEPDPNLIRIQELQYTPNLVGSLVLTNRFPHWIRSSPLAGFLEVAATQKISVRIVTRTGDTGWLLDSEVANQLTYHSNSGGKSELRDVRHVAVAETESEAFGLGYWQATAFNSAGKRIATLEIDWLALDQFVGDRQPNENFDNVRVLGLESTRFKHFVHNIRRLEQASLMGTFANPYYVDWATDQSLYKYLEHARRKFQTGELGQFEIAMLKRIPCCLGGEKRMPAYLWVQQYYKKRKEVWI